MNVDGDLHWLELSQLLKLKLRSTFPVHMSSIISCNSFDLRKSQSNSVLPSLLPHPMLRDFGMYYRHWWHGIQTCHHHSFPVGWFVLMRAYPSGPALDACKMGIFVSNHTLLVTNARDCCGFSGVIFLIEIVEGNGLLKDVDHGYFESLGKTLC